MSSIDPAQSSHTSGAFGSAPPSSSSDVGELADLFLSMLGGAQHQSSRQSQQGDSVNGGQGAAHRSADKEEKELQQLLQLLMQLMKSLAQSSGASDDDADDDGDDGGQQAAQGGGGGQQAAQGGGGGQQAAQSGGHPQKGDIQAQSQSSTQSQVAGAAASSSTESPAPGTGDTSNNPLNGKVDPKKPIYIPLNADGSYNSKALDALAKQGYAAAGVTQGQAQADSGPHAGNAGTDGGKWEVSDGFAKGILYGGAALASASTDGFTSKSDQEYAVTQSAVETGTDGSLSGRPDFTQGAGTGVGTQGQGPIQLDAQWHDQTDANNPFVGFTRAWEIGKNIAGGQVSSLKQDGLAYNTGDPTAGQPGQSQGQTEVRDGQSISYGAYWDSLVSKLNAGN